MDDIIGELTDNFQYGTEIVLFLILNEDNTSLNYLYYLGIKGKQLDNFKNCLPDFSLQYIKETIRFLRSGFLSINDIHNNLNSEKPIYFIPRLLKINEDWENAYEHFAGEFYSKQNKNKSR